MVEQRQISICVPSWQRAAMTIESFYEVYRDERVAEVIVVDDCSELEVYEDLKSMTDALPKVKLYRNIFNRDCYFNKYTAVSYATHDWVVLLDSDNIIDQSYIDRIFELTWDENRIYTPSFAKPHFNFTAYEGVTLSKSNIAEYIDKPMLETCLNACNYFVNKKKYCETFTSEIDPVTSDSIFMVKRWLERGGEIFIVPNLHYEHKVWAESHYQNNLHRTPSGFHQNILQQLREMK